MKNTNKILPLLAIVFSICSSGLSAQTKPSEENEYEIGGKMISYPKVDWLRGAPVTEFKKDSIYVVELWATWCKPCIASMPHISKLSEKFKGKIDFIAQDVMESDKAKVEQFLQKEGLGWKLKAAYAGDKNSDFHKNWIVPAGIFSIPQTFVIQNNKLVWQTYPADLNEEILQLLVDGQFTVEKAQAIAAKNKAAH
ncbi:TlpA disulfide reductase family protein [Flavobacterium sp. ENC]|uniref:TlpA family protein disulfide reductase n=1 Tax=Flavobacterium sp. ENC TaxID=2897330 RepID=UPI001E478647|nr:TlpA disulfide reductase family protein [Flavobacterium sp. ENC]MCD0466075.1 TlpA family protein disulfide reductase [Flavobacterium sp. ENC]